MLWQGYIDALLNPLTAIRSNANIIKSRAISPLTLIFLNLLNVFFLHTIRILIIFTTCIFFEINAEFFLSIIPISIMGIILFSGFGFLISPFTFLFSDMENLVVKMTRPLMFVSGVVIPLQDSLFAKVNPFYFFIQQPRNILLKNFPSLSNFILVLLGSSLIFLAGTTTFRRSFKILCDRI